MNLLKTSKEFLDGFKPPEFGMLPNNVLAVLSHFNGKNERNYFNEAKDVAAKLFADLNGWKVTTREFSLKSLVANSRQHSDLRHRYDWGGFMDHPLYFVSPVRPFRPMAIISQPYNDRVNDDPLDLSRVRYTKTSRWGGTTIEILDFSSQLKIAEPPMKFASFWFPKATRFFVVARKDVDVKWLNEQENDRAYEKTKFGRKE